MAELEIHHETEANDPYSRNVGIFAAIVAVLLAIVTILSHRAHTEGVLLKADVNDKWSYYESERIKSHNFELGQDLVKALGAATPAADAMLKRYSSEHVRYEEKGKEIMKQAQESEAEVVHIEKRALRYDLGEGMLEIGLVLSSLYFISKKKLFPMVGIVAAIAGIVCAIAGLLS